MSTASAPSTAALISIAYGTASVIDRRSGHRSWSRMPLSVPGASTIAAASNSRWVTRPASEFSATAPTAALRLSPSRRRKRTLTAMPPAPAGSRWLANAAANCTANTRCTGGSTGIEPIWVTVPTTQIAAVAAIATMSQDPSALARLCPPASTAARWSTATTITAMVTPTASRVWDIGARADAVRRNDLT